MIIIFSAKYRIIMQHKNEAKYYSYNSITTQKRNEAKHYS